MSFRATVLTLYPEMFPGPLGHSLAGKALERGLWSLEVSDIRAAAQDRHRTVDDSPAGGGPGMVMRADVLARAIDGATDAGERRRRLLMSPRGRKLDQALVRQLAAEPGVLIVCGHFEGVDERIVAARQLEEVSVGDYVLSGGEAAALIVLDAAVRLLPGVIGTARSSDPTTRGRACSKAWRSLRCCCRAITRRSPAGSGSSRRWRRATAGLICGACGGRRTVADSWPVAGVVDF